MKRKKSGKDEHDKAFFNEINQIINDKEVYKIIDKMIPIAIISLEECEKLDLLKSYSKSKAKFFINLELHKKFMAFAEASTTLANFYQQAYYSWLISEHDKKEGGAEQSISFDEIIKNTVKEEKTLVNNFKSTYEAFRHSVKRQLYL